MSFKRQASGDGLCLKPTLGLELWERVLYGYPVKMAVGFRKCGSPGMEAVAPWTAVFPLQLWRQRDEASSPSLGGLWWLELQKCLLWVNSVNSASLGGLVSYSRGKEMGRSF